MANRRCPLLNKPCIEHQCMWWGSITMNRVDAEPEVKWDCAINWIPFMQIQTAKETRQGAASFDKMATEMRHGAAQVIAGMIVRKQAENPQLENDDASNGDAKRLGSG